MEFPLGIESSSRRPAAAARDVVTDDVVTDDVSAAGTDPS